MERRRARPAQRLGRPAAGIHDGDGAERPQRRSPLPGRAAGVRQVSAHRLSEAQLGAIVAASGTVGERISSGFLPPPGARGDPASGRQLARWKERYRDAGPGAFRRRLALDGWTEATVRPYLGQVAPPAWLPPACLGHHAPALRRRHPGRRRRGARRWAAGVAVRLALRPPVRPDPGGGRRRAEAPVRRCAAVPVRPGGRRRPGGPAEVAGPGLGANAGGGLSGLPLGPRSDPVPGAPAVGGPELPPAVPGVSGAAARGRAAGAAGRVPRARPVLGPHGGGLDGDPHGAARPAGRRRAAAAQLPGDRAGRGAA